MICLIHIPSLLRRGVYPAIRTHNLTRVSMADRRERKGTAYRKNIIKTPNILAINHRLLDTRDQYFSSSFWAP